MPNSLDEKQHYRQDPPDAWHSLVLIHCHQIVPDLITHGDHHVAGGSDHELIYVLAGRYETALCSSPDKSWNDDDLSWHLCEPGTMFLYPAGTKRRIRVKRDGQTNLLCLRWQGPWPVDHGEGWFADPAGTIRSGLVWLHSLAEDPDREWQRNALLVAVLEEIRLLKPDSIDYLDPITEVHRFLTATMDHPITMSMLADKVGIGISTINQKFRQRYGVAPIAYLQRLRAEHAARLISTSNLPLQTIVQKVGLQSTSYLNRILKKHMGCTARELRKI